METAASTLKSICVFGILGTLPVFGTSLALAGNIAKFQSGFSKIRTSIEAEFDLAEQLNPPPLPIDLGFTLTQKSCAAVFQKAANAWYPHDPFAFQFTGGAARIPTCGGPTGKSQNFIEYSSGFIGVDQTYAKIVSTRDPGFVFENIRRYYFDAYDNLVAIINYEVPIGKTQVNSFMYQTEDLDGNQYHREWQAMSLESVTGIRGPLSSVRVIPSKSLKTPTQSLRNRWTDQGDPTKTRETRMVSQVLAADWEDLFIPMPQNWFSAFFKYSGAWYSSPSNWSQIFIKAQNGIELCFIGTVFKKRKAVENYPEIPADFDACTRR